MDEHSINKIEILARAKSKWNEKSEANKIRAGSKYERFFKKFNFPVSNWVCDFDELSKHQQSVITKGELIRTYDSLPNIEKTRIKREFGLSMFSSKWFKLPSADKKILLNYIIK